MNYLLFSLKEVCVCWGGEGGGCSAPGTRHLREGVTMETVKGGG